MKITLATYITLTRIVLTPFIMAAISANNWSYALVLFIIAMITDLLDGFIARRFDQASTLGALLDPVADKILLVGSMLAVMPVIQDQFILYALYFLICKEVVLVVGGALLYGKYRIFIKPSKLSRVASIAEMTLLGILIVGYCYNYHLPEYLLYLMISIFCMLSLLLLGRYTRYIMLMRHT
ncbi:MAG: hypothetical protein CL947_04685 [Epsilonproteobacteria bacterium]|nr:hypothetical protein [Campylobacterota bacterium]|tara:strand:+ start:356 stop:898 length:543 start_codon:yes stop_codon:yes gene_type:complete